MNLQIDRPEQKSRLERHASPGGIQTDDLAAGAVTGGIIPDGGIATAKLAASAVTPAKMSFTGLKVLAAAGKSSAGAITLTGTVIGDRLIAVFGAPTAGGALAAKIPGTDFEATVTVNNQIQQSVGTDLSASTFIFILIPAGS